MPDEIEKRTFIFETRQEEEGVLVGHAAVFNEYADIMWWKERILPGAFTESIKRDDVKALINHDPNYLLGRNKAGTLTLEEDEKGLAVRITPPNTQYAKDWVELINRGDVSQMSFAFNILREEWRENQEDGKPDERDIKEVKLYDVSIVTYPAYKNTDIAVRSYQEWKETLPKPINDNWKTDLLRKRLGLKLKGGY